MGKKVDEIKSAKIICHSEHSEESIYPLTLYPSPRGEGVVVGEERALQLRAMGYKKVAFTLAEVLITLSILGVIATLTVPNIYRRYKNKEIETKLIQVYSKFQTITDVATIETGLQPENWLTEEEKTLSLNDRREIIYNKYIKPYLKTKDFNKATGVFYDNKGVKYTLQYAPNTGNFFKIGNNPTGDSYDGLLGGLLIDINGDKKPNQYGKDIFYFIYKIKNGGPFNHHNQVSNFEPLTCGSTMAWGNRVYKTFEQYKEAAYSGSGTWPYCGKKGTTSQCCADVIMREGWKIKDDYPFRY